MATTLDSASSGLNLDRIQFGKHDGLGQTLQGKEDNLGECSKHSTILAIPKPNQYSDGDLTENRVMRLL